MEVEIEELDRVERALRTLVKKDVHWGTNWIKYCQMDNNKRARWWVGAKQQANNGATGMQILLLEVLKQRLKE